MVNLERFSAIRDFERIGEGSEVKVAIFDKPSHFHRLDGRNVVVEEGVDDHGGLWRRLISELHHFIK